MAIPILMYHNIAPVPREIDRQRSLYTTPRLFAQQMGLLRMLGYTGLSMSDAMPYLRGDRQGRVAVVTLDDGYVDNLENALPILKRNNFSATCYAVSGSLGGYNEWDARKLGIRKPIMSHAQLREWHDNGMEIGAHTRTHPHLTQCNDAQLRDEIEGSKKALEDLIGAPVTQFCYPYGSLDERVVAATREAGFTAATTVDHGRAQPGSDLFWLPRVKITRNHFAPQFMVRVLTRYKEQRKQT